jgi:hypothetical protein
MKRETKKTTRWLLPPIRRRKSSDRATVFIVIVSFEAYLFPPSPCRKDDAPDVNHLQEPVAFFSHFPVFSRLRAELSKKIALPLHQASVAANPEDRVNTVTVYKSGAGFRGSWTTHSAPSP